MKLLLPYLFALIGLTSCANPHFFPHCRPLFAGLDEAKVPSHQRRALAEAKADYQLARRGEAPQHAQYRGTAPYNNSRIYRGSGYTLTLVNGGARDAHGPSIVIDPDVTGARSFTYDEVTCRMD